VSATVLVTDYAWPTIDVERQVLGNVDAELLVARTGDEAELLELAPRVDAILTCWKPVTAAVLNAALACRTVARYGVGLDNIDIAAATELGVVVSNVPEFCTEEVADHAIALVLSQARHVARFATQTAAGDWDNRACGPMRRLRGQVLGLVGYGRIAQAVAARAVGFGFDVLAFSPSRRSSGRTDDVRFAANLSELLCTSDVVSLHLPSIPTTKGLIGAEALAAMKPGAVLINTSRGTLVEEDALVDALRSGRLAGAALDVLADEPPDPAHPLLAMPQVTVTPHAAFYSTEAITELQETAASNVAAVLAGELPKSIVNPEVLSRPNLRVPVRSGR
jgi:D-3-phosphoglycerate dehydrogenase